MLFCSVFMLSNSEISPCLIQIFCFFSYFCAAKNELSKDGYRTSIIQTFRVAVRQRNNGVFCSEKSDYFWSWRRWLMVCRESYPQWHPSADYC